MSNYKTKEAILTRGREAIGIPLKLIDKTGRINTGKGAVGTLLEESWFGIKPNNKNEPDFPEAGVELKATPYEYTKKGIRAKERLVCNIIDYEAEYINATFLLSSFWKKCNTILLMSYEHKKDVSKGEFTVNEVILFQFPAQDLEIIKQDWEIIMQKIKDGKAHEISEGDTLYLGACTKGATSASVRKQPNSEMLAKQRAYSLKQSYMTYILQQYVFSNALDEHIIKDPLLLRHTGFEDYIRNKIHPFIGQTQAELLNNFNITSRAKNMNELILASILGVSGKLSNVAEFRKANIIFKTIRIKRNGTIEQNMSFPTFKFTEIICEEWEESTLKNYLAPAKFLFVIFQENDNGELVLDRLKLWNIPVEDLAEVQRVWARTVQTIIDGIILTRRGGRTYNNLPKQSQSAIAHVRPHGQNSLDTYPLPDGRAMTKQCFWFNSSYVKSIINN